MAMAKPEPPTPKHALDALLLEAVRRRASDLHITVAAPPTLRIDGRLIPLTDPPMTSGDTRGLAELVVSRTALADHSRGEWELPYSLAEVSRFRIQVFRQRGQYSISARVIPFAVPAWESLGLPPAVAEWAERETGLILVTGPTGSGKSTTLAALVDRINQRSTRRIIVLEDPIEYLHRHRRSLIDQREIGADTPSFATGLRAALRQDIDVLVIGEMRDLETMQTAMTAAETGHLVMATLHTGSAEQTVERLTDGFPANQQAQVRLQLASVLIGVITQRLLSRDTGDGRLAVAEVLVNSTACANLIRVGQVHQLRNVLQTGRDLGMQTMEQSLRQHVLAGNLTESTLQQRLHEWGLVRAAGGQFG